LASAGRRALARGDTHAAASLLDRAVGLLPTDDRAALLPDLGDALMREGELTRAGAALDEAATLARERGDGGLAGRTEGVRLVLHFITQGEGWGAGAIAEVEGLVPALEAAGDDLGLARAWNLLAAVHGTPCRFAAAEAAADRALVHARRA